MTDPARRFSVLFLCTHNSARSQIAEAVLRARTRGSFDVASAGSDPAPELHPLAREIIADFGGDPSLHATKDFEAVLGRRWDLVITVCDRAREACPALPKQTVTAHWGLPDPATEPSSPDEQRAAFQQAFRTLTQRIDLLLALGPEKLERLALRRRIRETEATDAAPPEDGEAPPAGEVSPAPAETSPAVKPDAVVVLLSDVHGNLPALEAVLTDIERRGDASAVYHLGDLVGYAPWPNEVVELLHEREITGVAGNYDSTTATDYKHCGCRYEDPRQEALSHLSYAWTRENTTRETKRRLGTLPFRLDVRPLGGHTGGPRLVLIHGNPTLNTFYWTEDRDDGFCLKMAQQVGARAGDLIAFGHTHKPWHRPVEGIHFVNTGSVGRPKDGDPRAGYVRVTLADGTFRVEHVRVDYDVERAAKAIVASGLPADFADHLREGGAPRS